MHLALCFSSYSCMYCYAIMYVYSMIHLPISDYLRDTLAYAFAFLCILVFQLICFAAYLVKFIHAIRDLYKRRHIMERLELLKTFFSECALSSGALITFATTTYLQIPLLIPSLVLHVSDLNISMLFLVCLWLLAIGQLVSMYSSLAGHRVAVIVGVIILTVNISSYFLIFKQSTSVMFHAFILNVITHSCVLLN